LSSAAFTQDRVVDKKNYMTTKRDAEGIRRLLATKTEGVTFVTKYI
jgi:hypothetical protein